jgi:hypothetical protein
MPLILWAFSRVDQARIGQAGWRRSADRTGLRPQFPANREFYREFRRFRLAITIAVANLRANSVACGYIPCAREQGNILRDQGMILQEQGLLREKS